MNKADQTFTSSIAAAYEQQLVPLLYEPYALDLAGRLRVAPGSAILETAAGTGAVTRILATQLPADVSIVATDLNDGMLDIAIQTMRRKKKLLFRRADAMQLPFGDNVFDSVVCQFGVMFFSGKVAAYREAWRVLKPGGTFYFNAWTKLQNNTVCFEVCQAVRRSTARTQPIFFERAPYAYSDPDAIAAQLRAAGFSSVHSETIEKIGHAASPRDAAIGLCEGSPLRTEIYARGEAMASRCIESATAALERRFGPGEFDSTMSAHVFTAVKA